MKIHREFEQLSPAWMQAHIGVITVSCFDSLVDSRFDLRKGEMPKSLLAWKLAEWWQDGPLPGFGSFATEQGTILESEAIPWYELETGEQVERIGFITNDAADVGCSPDGLLGDDCGIEIKSPEAKTHVGYLLKGELPKEYAAQVHGSMYVTGFTTWKFLSYRRGFPPFMLTVERDDEIQKKLAIALDWWVRIFKLGQEHLTDLNGGPPERKTEKLSGERPRFTWEMDRNDVPCP